MRKLEKESEVLYQQVAKYYSEKIDLHGVSPQGVDWNGVESQNLRFEQLIKVIDLKDGFTVNDLGCGYGAFYDYLSEKMSAFQYYGVDVSKSMIRAALKEHSTKLNAEFTTASEPQAERDYTVSSGIFNVRLNYSNLDWSGYIEETLNKMNKFSKRGFAFNLLTSYSDSDKMKPYLYYANPCELFDFCKKNFSRNVALLHDYGLYEFTVLVRK